MTISQAVFLFDICSFSQVESLEQLNNTLKCLRLVCLRLITELCGKIPSFRFGFKFFDSKGTITQRSERFPFSEVNLEAFENLETEITRRYERYASVCKVVAESATQINKEKISTLFGTKSNLPVKVLNLILTQILCEYQWDSPEICSPVRDGKKYPSQNFDKNFVFLISPLPASESNLNDYFGVSDVSKSNVAKDLLMPSALYKKFVVEANISLVWINPTDLSHANVVEGKKSSTEIFGKALTELCGTLIPLQVLAESNLFASRSLLRVSDHTDKKSTATFENLHLQSGSNFSLPFSCLFSHYITSNPVSHQWPSENCSTLSFPNKLSIKIQLLSTSVYSERSLNMCNKANTSSPGPKRSRRSCVKKTSIVNQPNIDLCNFFCQYTIPRGFYGNPDFTYVCLPAVDDSNQQSSALREINKTLLCQNHNLVLKCETKVGFMGIGILSPLSEANSMISIFASTPAFLSDNVVTGDTKRIDNVLSFIDGRKEKLLKCLENFSKETVTESLGHCATYKTFDVTSMESWYMSNLKTSNLLTEMKTKWTKKENSHSGNFMSKLQHHYRTNSNINLSRKRSSEGLVRQSPRAPKLEKNGNNSHQQSTQNSEMIPLNLDFKNEVEVLKHLHEIYDSAVQLSEPVVKSAQSVINIVLTFFHSKSSEAVSNEVDAFMNTHILVTPSQIAQKYNDKSNPAETQNKVKEYQLQVILHLELVCHVSSSVDICVNKVTALLRALNFVVGPVELSRFLRDTVVGNYSSNLHHLLIEIGDELNIPLLPELFSPSSASDTESTANIAKSSTLSQHSIPSWRSTSSSSQRSMKSNSLSRRSLSGHFNGSQNRQIMVPTRLLRKHKTSEKIEPQPIRKSPRLAVKNNSNDLNSSTNAKASKICRNLFNAAVKPKKRCKSISPEKGNHKRRKLLTPKGHRTLKTNYVPETPSPKQGCSFQRRMARLRAKTDTVTEVMESPVCAAKSANISRLYMLRKNGSFYSKSTSNEYEMKQSSSILLSNNDDRPKVKPSRLFSEILHSPSVDHPSRRCSKRLFQNCTPTKSQSNNLKIPPKSKSNPIKTPPNFKSSLIKTSPGTLKSQLNSLKTPPSSPRSKDVVKTPPGTPKSKSNFVKTPPNTPKSQLSSLKTPPRTPESRPIILKIHRRTPKTNPRKSKPNVITYPDTPLKSILKRTPSKIIEDSNMAQSFGSPTSAVVLSLPMHEFPTPDKSTSPTSDSENFTSLQKTEGLEQSIQLSRNIKNQCTSSVIEENSFVSTSFVPQQSEQGHHFINAETQNMDKNGNQFQYFSSPRKTSSRISTTPVKDQQAFNQINNVSPLRSSRKLRSEKERIPSNVQSPSKAQNVSLHIDFSYNSNEDSLLNDKNDLEIKEAFTDLMDSPTKVTKSVSFAQSTTHEDIKFRSQDDIAYSSNVNTPPNAKVQQLSVHTPTLKGKKLYTSPTKSSLLHLATSPVIFIKKKNQLT